jgi:glycosyltransferase involved in cell wall biosynthesis
MKENVAQHLDLGEALKSNVRDYWNANPCGTQFTEIERGSRAFYDEVERFRYETQPFMEKLCKFDAFKGKTLLEIGCGLGTDLLQFARHGAIVTGVDLTEESIALAKKRFELYGVQGTFCTADAENLPFADNSFDVVYSFGVLHHTPNTQKAIDEIYRVVKHGGEIVIMLYHKHSLHVWLGVPLYFLYGLSKGKLWGYEEWVRIYDGKDNPLGNALLKRELGIPFLLQVEGSEVWVKKNWGKTYFTKALEWSEEIQFEQADAIIVVSSVLKSQLIGLGVPPEKITVVPNGVDAEKYSPDISGENIRKKFGLEEKFVIGYAGTFGYWHGITVLANSVKKIVGEIPNAHFLLIGDGVLRGEVEAILRRDSVERAVTITGMMPSADVPEYLAACNALVISAINNPDVPFFQSPIKLFEYMAMQKPVIASRVGQIQEVIEDGVNGLLVEENNPAELAEKICQLARDPALCERLSKAARRDAVEKYAWQENARAVINVYEQHRKCRIVKRDAQ